MSKDRSVYIRHIHDCIGRINAYTSGGEAEFFSDAKTQDAVVRNLEVIGQAIKDYGVQELTAAHAEIPWEQIAGCAISLPISILGLILPSPGMWWFTTFPDWTQRFGQSHPIFPFPWLAGRR